jgi:hypothetical protein
MQHTSLLERRFFLQLSTSFVRSFHCLCTALSGEEGNTLLSPSSPLSLRLVRLLLLPPLYIIGYLLFLVFLPLSSAAVITTCPDHFAPPGRPSLSSLHSQQLRHGFLVVLRSGFLKSRFVGFQSYHFAPPSRPCPASTPVVVPRLFGGSQI